MVAVNEDVAERVRREIEIARQGNGKEIETMGSQTKASTGPAGSLPLWWEKSGPTVDPNVLRVDNGGDGWVILEVRCRRSNHLSLIAAAQSTRVQSFDTVVPGPMPTG